MKKYSFLVYHADYQQFLLDLRKLGVLDVAQRTKDYSPQIMDKLLLQKQVSQTIKLLAKRINSESPATTSETDGFEVVEKVKNLSFEEEQIRQQLGTISKEIANLQPWGDFSPETLLLLQKNGLKVSFFIASQKKYDPEWEKKYNIGVVNTISPNVYFILVKENDDEEIDIDAEEIRMPERSLSVVIEKKKQLEERLSDIGRELDELANTSLESVKKSLDALNNQTEFEKVLSNSVPQADERVMLLQGFVPVNKEQELIRFCEEKDIVYLSDDPQTDDKVPVLLENDRFSRLFEPISKLFSLPAYTELDLTPFFAPFFMMFFGFCLGDAGYGLLVLLGATLYKRKAKATLRPYLSLAQYLGTATVIFGIISGTFFGINLIEANIPVLESVKGYFLDSQKMFYLALILGAVQIVFGMVVKVMNIARQQGFKYALSTIGWLLLIFGMGAWYLIKSNDLLSESGAIIFLYSILALSGILILFLNDPSVNVFVRVGKGVWDIYGMVTGVFGDLLSYIRLFALGISSAILGLVINSIGLNMLGIPILGPVLFVLFLTVGHIANILISSLGSFVHPMRLTFVEFYKNAGFTGGGKAYKPFAEKVKTK